MRLRVAGLLVLLTLMVLSAGAQQQPSPLDTPIFRSAVDAIELDAFVFDAQGNPVTDLTENDFEIIEDGQLQEIASFAVVNIPIETTVRPVAATTAVADVRTNEQPEGRIYLIAVDEIPGASFVRAFRGKRGCFESIRHWHRQSDGLARHRHPEKTERRTIPRFNRAS